MQNAFLGCLVLATCFAIQPVSADNWPQWRGPRGDSICDEIGLPTQWSDTENVKWRLPLPGPAGATPVVWEDRIFLTSIEGDDLVLLCASTNGEILWSRTVGTGNQDARSGEGNSASPSPCTDGEHVWCFFGTGHLACYDFAGNEVWAFNVQDRYGRFAIQFGMTSTPVLDGDHLYLQLIHGEMREDYIVGLVIKLDKLTGEEVWAVERPTEAIVENKHSYASPFIYDDGEQRLLIAHGADCTTAHDLETGAEVWRVSGLNGPSNLNETSFDPTLRFVASPTCVPGAILIPTAKAGPMVAVSVSGDESGELSESDAVAWAHHVTPDVSCPLVIDGLVYGLMKDGKLVCLDLETGEELYYERTHGSEHRATPVYADGHIYLPARDGFVTVVKAGREFEVVAENSIPEALTASPVFSNGVLYLRTHDALYAIAE
jgi:outer membrane protein assembly factor BamB